MAKLNKRNREALRFGTPERLVDKIAELDWFPPANGLSDDRPDPAGWSSERRRWAAKARWVADGIMNSVPVVADNVADYVFSNVNQDFAWRDLPPIVLPFPRFFIEFKRPAKDRIRHHHSPTDGDYPTSWGLLFATLKPDSAFEMFGPICDQCGIIKDSLSAMAWVSLITERSGGITGPIVEHYIFIDHSGRIIGQPAGLLLWASLYEDQSRLEGTRHYLHTLTFPALLSLAFMNCKNVSVQAVDPPREFNRERKKHGRKPFVRYHTINIEPMKKVLRTEGRIETEGFKKALHLVRGHFATYTPDKPLFGRIAGTVWKPAHTRGEIKEGVVVSDYTVSAPQGSSR